MSLLPYSVDDAHNIPKEHSNMNWDMLPSEWLHSPLMTQILSRMYPCPSADELYKRKGYIGKDGLQVRLDVKHFHASEITVKTIDNFIVVDAQHEEKEDEHGYVFRHFERRYPLPIGFKSENVISSISSDGILTVTAPKTSDGSQVRHLKIERTGPIRSNVIDKGISVGTNELE